MMKYRKVGAAGLKLSELSFGSWVTFSNQVDMKLAKELIVMAYDAGVNFFDNAEVYAGGKSEEIMGQVFKELGLPRLKYCVSTKFFWGITDGPNERNTLNRKYLMNAITGSLKRLQMDYVDLVYCHRADPDTPMEEIVWSMHDMVERGYAQYWGTSEWSEAQVTEAFEVAEKYSLRKPIVEQPQYNLLERDKVEDEFRPLFEKYNYGLTTWSPLASGLLTGKYLNNQKPAGSRLSLSNMAWLAESTLTSANHQKVAAFVELAKKFDVSPTVLALAWCLKNKNVSSVILGATKKEQLSENLKASDYAQKMPNELYTLLNELV